MSHEHSEKMMVSITRAGSSVTSRNSPKNNSGQSLTSLMADAVNRRDSTGSVTTGLGGGRSPKAALSSSPANRLLQPTSAGGSTSSGPAPPRTLLTMSPDTPAHNVPVSSPTGRGVKPLGEVDALNAKHEADFKVLVPSIAEALQQMIVLAGMMRANRGNDDSQSEEPQGESNSDGCLRLPHPHQQAARFLKYNLAAVPSVQLSTYVKRISEYTFISPATLVASAILLERMLEMHLTQLALTELNVHKLFLTAVRIASKMVDLKALNNANFAKVVGVSNEHLNDLECSFLMDLEFNVFISAKQFFSCVCKFHEPTQQVLRRKASNSSFGGSTAASSAMASPSASIGKRPDPEDF